MDNRDNNNIKTKSNPYSKRNNLSVDNGYKNRNEKFTTQEIKAVVEEQIKNYEENEDFMDADEYKSHLNTLIKK